MEVDRLAAELRPKLHRYCARMTGSVIDGEDVVQEAFLKAMAAARERDAVANPEGWLFRIAHNAALDFLRRGARRAAIQSSENPEALAVPVDPIADRETAAASLRTFMRLPPAQRSTVILRDVLGYTLEEICAMTGGSLTAAKSALQRGRERLRALAAEPEWMALPVLADAERARLAGYVACFNARDFETVRRMLADDVRLDLVNRLRARGRAGVGEYFGQYARAAEWRFAAGLVDRRLAMLVYDRHDPSGRPAYFVLLEWANGSIASIRDFLFARYVLDGAELLALAT